METTNFIDDVFRAQHPLDRAVIKLKFVEYFCQSSTFTQNHAIIDNATKYINFSTHFVEYGI